MQPPSIAEHAHLREVLARLVVQGVRSVAGNSVAAGVGPEVDVVVTPNEMNDKHGTGPLVRRVFEGSAGIFSIRARDDYGGEHDFGEASVLLPQGGVPRPQAFQNVLAALEGRRVRRVVCVPFIVDDLITSIALKEMFDAPLCTWIMDDQNVCVHQIPDDLMREFLGKCALRLTTHHEMRAVYEEKYRLPFWILPAVAPGALVSTAARVPGGPEFRSKTGALVGSIWSQRWFDLVRQAVGGSGHTVDWYGNNKSPYFQFPDEQLQAAHIRALGIVPEPRLAEILRAYPYAVVPTGTLEGDSGNALAVAQLSLPGRILFIAATSNTPVIILGSPETPASRFVKRFDIGVTADYTPEAFRAAIEQVAAPDAQRRMRRNAAAIARNLSSDGVGEWLWRSLESGRASDPRFEELFPR